VKLRDVADGVMIGWVTVTLTGTITEVAPVAEIVTVPLNVPALVSTELSTETFTGRVPEVGVVPDVLSIFNHAPPVVVAAAALKLIPPGAELTAIGCGIGAELPIW
jgi:hypothetical protein